MSVFEVAITPDANAGSYRVEVLNSPDGGWACEVVGIDVDSLLARRHDLEVAVLLSGVSARQVFPEEHQLREVGRVLFRALLGTGEVAGKYRAAAAVADERREGLRVVLRLGAPALAALPWEAMFDDAAGGYVCRRDQLIRHVGVLTGTTPLPVDPPLRILGIVSSPADLPEFDVAREKELLARTLTRAAGPLAELAWAPAATWADLQDMLLSGTWHVVHFIGHGDFDRDLDEGVLALTDDDGYADMVEASRLVSLLRQARPSPRLVVLNSCSGATASVSNLFSGTAAALVRGGIGAVTAMQFRVTDAAATAYSRGFYAALTRGRGIDEAVSSGRTAIIGLHGRTLEWVTPVLYQSGHDSRLFTVRPAPRSVSTQAPASTQTSHGPSRWVRTIMAHAGGVFRVRFSPDGTLLGSAGADGAVRLWDAGSGAEAGVFTSEGNLVRGVAFWPDGSLIASAWSDGTVRLFATASRRARGLALDPDAPHSGMSDDGSLFSLLSTIFCTEESATTFLRAAGIPDGFIPAWRGNAAQFWNQIFDELRLNIYGVAYRNELTRALRGYRAEGFEALGRSSGAARTAGRPQTFASHSGWVTDVAVSRDGALLASVGEDGMLLLRHMQSESVRSLVSRGHRPKRLALSPDGALLATAGEDGTVRLWSTADHTQVRSLTGHPAQVLGVAFSPDGRLIGSAGDDSPVRLWDAVAGSQVRVLPGAFRRAQSVAFGPDGRVLAAATDDHVSLWNVAQDTAGTLAGHAGTVFDVAFSPDGTLLASAGADGTIRVWE